MIDDLASRILYQNKACIAINKLKGEAVEGAKQGMTDLPRLFAAMLGEEAALVEAVNRLDVPVTGCALFALDKKALVFLNAAFNNEGGSSSVEKIYWAVLEKPSPTPLDSPTLPNSKAPPYSKVPPDCSPLPESRHPGQLKQPLAEAQELVHWIETSSGRNKSFAYDSEAPGRKKASLYYKITGEGRNYLFAEIRLLSGRHHQIRAQLAAVGLHIKGDLKYGAKRSEKSGGIRLHSRSLSFPNPLNKDETIHLTADPPEMDSLWEQFKAPHSGVDDNNKMHP